MTTPIGISAPCVRCGMEKGGNLLYCPTCEITNAVRDQNNTVDYSGGSGFLGMLTGLVLVGYFLYWLFT